MRGMIEGDRGGSGTRQVQRSPEGGRALPSRGEAAMREGGKIVRHEGLGSRGGSGVW